MKRKKLSIIVCFSLAVVALCVGSTFAWFTARDDVMNKFETGKAKVEIEEDFNKDDATNFVPGVDVNKDVRAINQSNYKSFIRLKINPVFTKAKEGVDVSTLDISKLSLNYNDSNLTTQDDLKEGNWVLGDDGYYYFLKVLDPEEKTTDLLDSVSISKSVKKQYGNAEFDVNVDAESIQASNGASAYAWKEAGPKVTEKLSSIAKDAGLE